MSIGLLERLSNVLFPENAHHCRAGKYGYIKKEASATLVICSVSNTKYDSTKQHGTRVAEIRYLAP